ncbi:MAG: hypothetical protein WCG42_10185, partial [Parachlamydiaceae bacterium]
IISSLAKTKVAEFLENNDLLKAALPAGYADRLKAQKATGAVTLLIEEQFKTQELKTQVEKIHDTFSDKPEQQQLQIIKDVATILKQCDTESEKQEVATTLANQPLLSEGLEAYSKLLNAVKKSGSSPLVYYMQQAQLYSARNNDTTIEELCEKAAYFIGDAIPALASRYKNLSIVEFAPLISSIISAGRPKELSEKVEVGDDVAKWQRISADLSAAKKNPVELEKILGKLEPGQKKALLGSKVLQEHLEGLKKTKSTEEEVQAPEKNTIEGFREYSYKTLTSMLQQIGSIFRSSNSEETVGKDYKITTTYKLVKDPARLDEELVAQVLIQAEQQAIAAFTYGHALTESIAIIDKLIEAYPSAKSMLLPLTKNYLEHKGDPSVSEPHIKKAYGNLKNLAQELAVLDNPDMVISLCEHFSHEGKYKFTDLMTIFNMKGYISLGEKAKKQLFTVITSLLNNKKTCQLTDIQELLDNFASLTGEQCLNTVTAIYRKAPYPELSQFNQWSTDSTTLQEITDKYNTWSTTPVARENESLNGEEPVNGFSLEHAKKQSTQMSGITYTDEELEKIKNETDSVQKLTTDDLLAQIQAIRADPAVAQLNPTNL